MPRGVTYRAIAPLIAEDRNVRVQLRKDGGRRQVVSHPNPGTLAKADAAQGRPLRRHLECAKGRSQYGPLVQPLSAAPIVQPLSTAP